jgi:hypothetical protein
VFSESAGFLAINLSSNWRIKTLVFGNSDLNELSLKTFFSA